jgi:hypothetical protein
MTLSVSASSVAHRLAVILGMVVAGAVPGASQANSPTPPQPEGYRAPTRLCLLQHGVSVRLVSGKAAIGQEGDLGFTFPSERGGRLSFFRTYAAAQSRAVSDAHDSKLRAPYRVLNVEVAWKAQPGAPTPTEKAVMSGCIRERGIPPTG